MKGKTLVLVIAIIVAGFSFSLMGAFKTEEKLSLPAEGIDTLVIDCGAGFLKIKGVDGLEKIEVLAEIKTSGGGDRDEVLNKRVELTLEKKGSKAILVSKIKKKFLSFGSNYINLTVRIPAKLNLVIDDGSGSIEIAKVNGGIDLEDGSGSMQITGVKGNMDIVDGSGSMTLKDIKGNLKIKDGSGTVKIKGVGGNLILDDGSGSVYIKNVKGSVEVEDGSGSMDILNTGGSVIVDDGSGSVTIDGVGENVTIKEAGSGSLKIKNVKGKVKK